MDNGLFKTRTYSVEAFVHYDLLLRTPVVRLVISALLLVVCISITSVNDEFRGKMLLLIYIII